ncbi:hypothetical protein DPMN_172774 [Dreissena polymorpha]|uniref:Uncharacterized protein n=1 Tax=Dreissena polymorpha TaxID=45954 RepID=A0A9D4IEX4_DREPO|nr:hypothetical protein DPMN_172774 [Dreissena polymorpha]
MLKQNFAWAWSMCVGPPIEIDRIVIRDVQYHFEVNRCRNEEFQGSSAYDVGGDYSGQDRRMAEITTISPRLLKPFQYTRKKSPPPGSHVFQRTDSDNFRTQHRISFAHLRGTNILVINVNARVFTNQMWTDGQRTKTNPKTTPVTS